MSERRGEPCVPRSESDDRAWQARVVCAHSVTSRGFGGSALQIEPCTNALSRRQADLLATHFDRAVLMLDGDEAGRLGSVSAARNTPTARD